MGNLRSSSISCSEPHSFYYFADQQAHIHTVGSVCRENSPKTFVKGVFLYSTSMQPGLDFNRELASGFTGLNCSADLRNFSLCYGIFKRESLIKKQLNPRVSAR